MDSDCLIKLTKAGLKETVCGAWQVDIPELVEYETVRQAPDLPDARRIGRNIAANRLSVQPGKSGGERGEDEVLGLFHSGRYHAIASDDARFIRTLRVLGIPFAVPSVIVVHLWREGRLSRESAEHALRELRPYVNPDQYAAAVLMLSERSG